MCFDNYFKKSEDSVYEYKCMNLKVYQLQEISGSSSQVKSIVRN